MSNDVNEYEFDEDREPFHRDIAESHERFTPEQHRQDAAIADSLHTPEDLQRGLQHQNPGVRSRVVDRLVARGRAHPNTLPALLRALEDPDPVVRDAVATALIAFKAQDVRPALEHALNDPDAGVREAAEYALSQLHTGT